MTYVKGTGAIKDKKDKRDFKYKNIARSSTPFTWAKGFNVEDIIGKIPVKDQNGSSSCGGQAWAYYASVLEALATKSFEERSAKYIYAQTFVPSGGSAGRNNCDICIKQGVAREVKCPSYFQGNPPNEYFMTRVEDITQEARDDAKLAQSISYANVNPDIDLFAQAIRDNGGLVMGVDGQNNGTWQSAFPKPPQKGEWAHWLFAHGAKLINGKKFIMVKNSWGDVGEDGTQYIGEDYFNTHNVWYGWTLVPKPIVNNKYIFTRNMQYGDRSEDVRQLQIRLGFPSDLCTGGYYNQTRLAVYQYQLSHVDLSFMEKYIYRGLYCGEKTRRALNI